MKRRILFCGEASFLSTGFATFNREVLRRLHTTGRYELAEMASFVSQNDPRAKNIPWGFYGVSPSNQQEKQAFDALPENEKAVYQFGKHKINAVLADFQPDVVFDCVPPGELVYTRHGYRPIEDIAAGDLVMTHKGRFRPVKSAWSRSHNGQLVKISVNGNRDTLRVTPNHPVLVFQKRNQTNRKKSYKKIYKDVKPEFVKAKDLKKGDLVVLPKFNGERKKNTIDITDYVENYTLVGEDKLRPQSHGNLINRYIDVDEKFARLIGYILGDGYINYPGIQITFGENESNLIDDAQVLIEDIFGLRANVRPYVDKAAKDIYAHSVVIREFLDNYLKDLHVPEHFYVAEDSIISNLISGMVRSDGCYKKRTVSFANTAPHLIYEYRALCTTIGVPTNITYSLREKETHKTAYEVSTYGSACEDLHRIVDKSNYDFKNATNPVCSSRRTQIVNGFLTSSITSIEIKPYDGLVYNFEVEEDNSYCVKSWTTHNCRDPWMLAHLTNSRYRNYYKLVLTPTVDSAPSKREWIDKIYRNADVLTAYSRFGKKVLEKDGLDVGAVTSPGCDLSVFKPLDKDEIRDKFHLNKSLMVFGTVMRNQRRKLFPDLFEAYARMRNKYAPRSKIERIKKRLNSGKSLTKSEKDALKIHHSVLLCHTSWPDNAGWDLPDYIFNRFNIQRHVLFTYKCNNCQDVYVSWFIPTDQRGYCVCRSCGEKAAHMPSTHDGIDEDKLVEIFNLIDVYIQPAICEGWGLPIMEAKACGVPGLYQNYSAMEDHVENGGGLPIKIERFYHEAETAARRSLPDLDDMVNKMRKLALNDKLRASLGREARETCERMHTWEITAKQYENIFDSVELHDRTQTWDAPPRIEIMSNERPPANIDNRNFVIWLYVNILRRQPDEKGFNDWMVSLLNGTSRAEVENFFRQQILLENKFEETRWIKSLKRRGIQPPQRTIVNTGAPGVLI